MKLRTKAPGGRSKTFGLDVPARLRHASVFVDLEMYEDGSVSPESVALLKQLRAAIRGN